MCGRFTQFYTWHEVHAFLDVLGDAAPRNLQPRYNIAPTDTIDVAAIGKEGDCKLVPMRWGLIPSWWRNDPKKVGATFNARRESVESKPMFRSALKEGRRCVIPMSGFYEWTNVPDGKQPFFVSGRDQPVLGVAGLWDRWRNPAGDWMISATMIVQPANDVMGALHTRMPVFIVQSDIAGWLDGRSKLDDLAPTAAALLQARAVSRRVNKVGTADDASLIESIALPPVNGEPTR